VSTLRTTYATLCGGDYVREVNSFVKFGKDCLIRVFAFATRCEILHLTRVLQNIFNFFILLYSLNARTNFDGRWLHMCALAQGVPFGCLKYFRSISEWYPFKTIPKQWQMQKSLPYSRPIFLMIAVTFDSLDRSQSYLQCRYPTMWIPFIAT